MAIPDFPDTLPCSDVYLDDQFEAFLEQNWTLGRALLPFMIRLVGRLADDNDPIARDGCLSMSKFLAEATPDERKIVLGWLIDTRKMMISLPPNKVKAWKGHIQTMLDEGKTTKLELTRLLGRL